MPSLADHQSNSTTKLTVEDVANYFDQPIMVNEHGCWLWTGQTDKRGYGRKSSKLIHGIVWRLAGFECGQGKELCHKCEFKACVNPDHLYAGTHWQNMQDAMLAGVMGREGQVAPDKIATAIEMLDQGQSQTAVGKFLGMSQQWVSKFSKGKFKYAKPC